MFLWVQLILLVVSEIPANIYFNNIYITNCYSWQGVPVLSIPGKDFAAYSKWIDSEVESSMENEGRSGEG